MNAPRNIAHPFSVLTWLVALTCTVVCLHAQNPTQFESQILAYEALDQQQPPPDNPIVFVGSSSIRMWTDLPAAFPNYPAINRGFGGSTMKDLLYYFDRLVAVYEPSLVVVYEGDNDLAGGAPVDDVYEDFVTFVTLMEEQIPESDFAFISVKPSPSRAAILDKMIDLNTRLKTLAEEHDGLFMDVYERMVDEEGNPLERFFLSDNLHMNSAGYRVWRQVITPVLDEWDAQRSAPPRFTSITFDGTVIFLEWEGAGLLEFADHVNGPWTPLYPAENGRYEEEASAPSRFFRLVPE
jgi:lysophospholipase L1-like esterase